MCCQEHYLVTIQQTEWFEGGRRKVETLSETLSKIFLVILLRENSLDIIIQI